MHSGTGTEGSERSLGSQAIQQRREGLASASALSPGMRPRWRRRTTGNPGSPRFSAPLLPMNTSLACGSDPNATLGQSETSDMARKATINKSAAKKADARKPAAPKAAARPSSSPAKSAPRKEQPASVHAKGAAKTAAPKVESKINHASKAAVKKPQRRPSRWGQSRRQRRRLSPPSRPASRRDQARAAQG